MSDNGFNLQIDALVNIIKNTKFISCSMDTVISEKIRSVSKTARISSPRLDQERRAYTRDELAAIYDLDKGSAVLLS